MNVHVWQYPEKTEPVRSTFPEANLDWLAVYPDQIFDLERPSEYPYFVRGPDPSEIPAAEEITVDKWLSVYPDQIFDLERPVEYPSVFFQIDEAQQPEVITPDKWTPVLEVPLFDVERLNEYDYFFYVAEPSVFPAIVEQLVDKWSAQYPDQIEQPDHRPWVPCFFMAPEPPTGTHFFILGIEGTWTIPAGGKLWTIPGGGKDWKIPGGGKTWTIPGGEE